ncbi:MAG TPA: carboxypeptidase regulatory-like domain-containing protein [Vicinamibacterales bacterium]|nr:carboxypeptidase regulatory-like domain-containing protein [Vicinamibacterales bacterium]
MNRHAVVLGFFVLLATASTALAQSAIAGVVRDTSGAVLPGVTVDVSSPALIEGTRSAVTDGTGQYRIVDLRPGEYTVVFTLPSFRTVRREGIVLPVSFTATVNAELAVGTLQEALTVTGASPLVDVRGSVSQTVMNREVRDTIPTGKDPFAIGQLIAGVTTSTPDVGGTQVMQQPTLQVHGSSNNDNVFMVDSVQIQHIGFGGNQTGFYFNDGLMAEISYQTSSLPAEAPVGGVQINMIPNDGGNTFHGSFFSTGAKSGLQANNLDQDLINLGFKAQNRVQSVYDFNGTFGGPIKKDRLWFFGTIRRWSANNYLGNTFTSTGDQAIDDQHITDATIRATWQASKANKLTLQYDRNIKWRGHRPNNWLSASINDPISDVVQTTQLNHIAEAKWTSTLSDKLLAEASVFNLPVNYTLGFEPDASPNAIATFDQIKSVISGVSPRMDTNSAMMNTYAGSLSYVTGTHAFKVGTQIRTGWSQELFTMRGDMLQITNSGVANSVRLVNTPSGHKESGVNAGIYVQDSWRFDRLTLNPGLRYEHFGMSIPAQSAPAGTWIGARDFPEQDGLVNWNTLSPRLGFAYDVTGDGRTAVKGGVSRYDRLEGITLIQPLDQRNIAFELCPWTDTNLDGIAQTSEIAMTKCSGSLQPTLGSVDPNLKRPHQWEYTVMVQRQIGANTSVSVGYYGRRFGDLYTTVNALVPPTAYTPVTITNPLNGAPLTVYNQDPATKNLVQNEVATIPDLSQSYNGVEFQVNTRMTKATMFGGLTIGRDHGDNDSGDLNNPNVRINNNGAIGFDSTYQIRGGFSYELPYDVRFSGSVREATGLPQTRTYTVTTSIVPGLTQVNQSVKVAAAGDFRYPWQNLVDIRFVRTFRARSTVIEPTLDVFNLFNNNAVTSAVTTVGGSLGRPSAIVMGRLARVGVHVTF